MRRTPMQQVTAQDAYQAVADCIVQTTAAAVAVQKLQLSHTSASLCDPPAV